MTILPGLHGSSASNIRSPLWAHVKSESGKGPSLVDKAGEVVGNYIPRAVVAGADYLVATGVANGSGAATGASILVMAPLHFGSVFARIAMSRMDEEPSVMGGLCGVAKLAGDFIAGIGFFGLIGVGPMPQVALLGSGIAAVASLGEKLSPPPTHKNPFYDSEGRSTYVMEKYGKEAYDKQK